MSSSCRCIAITIVFFIVIGCLPARLFSHTFNTSYTYIDLSGSESRIFVVFDLLELQAYTGLMSAPGMQRSVLADSLSARIRPLLHLSLGGEPITVHQDSVHFETDDYDNEFVKLQYSGPLPAYGWHLKVKLNFFDMLGPVHRNFLTVKVPKGRYEAVLNATAASESFIIARDSSAANTLVALFRTTIASFLSNYLQILLIVGVVLLCRETGGVLKTISAFGLAATAASVIGYAQIIVLPQYLLFLLICASVVYIAIENLFVRQGDDRWIIAFAFGLLHGFVNAGVLAEMGLPAENKSLVVAGYGLVTIFCYLVLAFGSFLTFRWLTRRISHRKLVYLITTTCIAVVVLVCIRNYLA